MLNATLETRLEILFIKIKVLTVFNFNKNP